MNVAFLGLGGNMGDRLEYLEKTRLALERECGTVLKSSEIYETEAWGSNSTKKYLNQVVKLGTTLNAEQLLKKTLAIEKKLGRKRGSSRNSDRTVDIDLLLFNNEEIQHPQLQIPHPRLHLRKFVLVPLCDIDKKIIHPTLKKSVHRLLKDSSDNLEVNLFRAPKKLSYISIEGNIGSGKSTLARALSKKLKGRLIPEQFEENHLLPLFYSDPRKYAFPLEYSFLIQRFEQLSSETKNNSSLRVSDFSIHKCLWFAKVNLPKKEYTLFKKHFDAFSKQLKEPELMIYLKSDTKNLKQNIAARGRSYEEKIPEKYLKDLSKQYEKGISELTGTVILEISIKKYGPKLEQELLKRIEKYIKENFG